MRVLFIQKIAGTSGSEYYFLKILPLLRNAGIDCRFLGVSLPEDVVKNENFYATLKQKGVPYYSIETTSVLSYSLVKKIAALVKKENFDIVHTHLIHADFWGACLKLLFNRKLKLVSTKHGYDEGFQAEFGLDHTKRKTDTYFLTALFAEKFVNRSFAVSNGLHNFYMGKGISKPDKIETILFGLDFAEDVKKNLKTNCRFFQTQLIIVGRIIPYKGQAYVLQCMPGLVKKHPGVGLVLVGWGASEPGLKEEVKRLNLQNYVRFEGKRPNVHDYLEDSDIAIMPSKAEGFGIVMLEAWHHKKPVVAFDVPAPNTVITHNQNGILVTPFDVRELEKHLDTLISNPDERRRLGEAGYQTLQTEFARDKMVTNTIAFYEKVLNE